MRWLCFACCATAILTPAAARASVTIAVNVDRAALRVDAAGNAEVSWLAGGARRSVLVPAQGLLLPGGRLSGPDVSRAVTAPVLPFRRALRRTPDGRLWALQAWRVGVPGTLELRFSRWRGAPTLVTATATLKSRTVLIEGQASFQGRPVTGYSPTPEGDPIRLSAFVDCFACRGSGWARVTGKATRAGGKFGTFMRREWLGPRYRVIVPGPNRGTTLAPDAAVIVASPG